jgi:hypothetical protein
VDANLLNALAARGGGRFYNTQDAGSLPAIFAHESHLASRSYLIEHVFSPKRTAPSPILQDIAETPPLRGYVGTTIRPSAVLALVSDAGDPVLAHWQYGLGRVAAWTSDATGRWAQDWIPWSGFPTFWGALARWSMGTDNAGGLQARVDVQGDQARISLDAVGGAGDPINGLHPLAAVVPPAAAAPTATLELQQTAPGHYEGTAPVSGEGAYLVRVQSGNSPDAPGAAQTLGFVVPYSPEYRLAASGDALLASLRSITGGRALALDAAGQAAVFRHDLPPAPRTTDLWPWLLLIAALLLPLDIGVRRVLVGWRDLPRFLEEARGRLAPAPAPVVPGDASAAATLGSLFEARRRQERRAPPAPAREIAGRLARDREAPAAPPPGLQPHAPAGSGVQITGRTPDAPEAPPASGAAGGNIAGEVLRRRKTRDG